ncbi:hypothetical protein ACVOMT_03610 [Sphingomonas panni]
MILFTFPPLVSVSEGAFRSPFRKLRLLASSFATAESLSEAVIAWYRSSIPATVETVHPSIAAISDGVAPA